MDLERGQDSRGLICNNIGVEMGRMYNPAHICLDRILVYNSTAYNSFLSRQNDGQFRMSICIWVRDEEAHLSHITSFTEWKAGLSPHILHIDQSYKGSVIYTIFTTEEDDAASFKLKWM